MKIFLALGLWALTLTSCSSKVEVNEDQRPELQFLNCRNDQGPASIVKGSQVTPQDPQSKLAVMLIVDHGDGSTSTCTGAPISDRVLLTAAHCVKGVSKTSVHAIFHSDLKCSSGYDRASMTIPSTDVIMNTDYNGKASAKDDLALVKLATPIPASYPVAVLYNGTSPLSSDDVLMIGYGVTTEWRNDSRVLRKTLKSFEHESYIKDNNIAFDQRGSSGGVCSGDSGGPIYIQSQGRYQIIGINSVVSGSSESTACHEFSIALYAPYYASWIQKELLKLQ